MSEEWVGGFRRTERREGEWEEGKYHGKCARVVYVCVGGRGKDF